MNTVLNLITQLENKLKALITLYALDEAEGNWQMDVELLYESHPAGPVSFNLNGYSQEEAEAIARDFKHNQALMQEVDLLLWGEMD